MSKPEKLWKRTLVIWSDKDSTDYDLEDLAREAERGDMICLTDEVEEVTDSAKFPETDFFEDGVEVEDKEEEDPPQT